MTTAISPTRRSAIVGTKVTFKNLAKGGFAFQQRIAIIAHSNTAASNTLTKTQISTAVDAGTIYGFGSQIHIMATQLFPSSGDGVGDIPVTVYPLADGTTAADGIITPTGVATADGTYTVTVGNVTSAAFIIPDTTIVAVTTVLVTAAINATVDMPVTAASTATTVDLTAKWKGLTGNEPLISVDGPSAGIAFGITPMASGAGDPTIDSTLLDQFGEVWETCVLNGLGGTAAALDALANFDEGLWLPAENRFLTGAFYATKETSLATAIVVPDGRKTDRTNVQLSAQGSADLSWKIAARMVARIAVVANSASPASDYIGQIVSGIAVGSDTDQWISSERNTAVLSGASTSVSRDGVIQLNDTITFYHPTGDPTPAYRWVNDKVKLQQIVNDIDIVFNTPKWQAPPLIPDGQATSDRTAKQPKMAAAELTKLINSWALRALISDPESAIASIVAAIDGSNARRLNLAFTVNISGNAGIISTDFDWGFFFGGAAA